MASHGLLAPRTLGRAAAALVLCAIAMPTAPAASAEDASLPTLLGVEQLNVGTQLQQELLTFRGAVYFFSTLDGSYGTDLYQYDGTGPIQRVPLPDNLTDIQPLTGARNMVIIARDTSAAADDPYVAFEYDGSTVVTLGPLGLPLGSRFGAAFAWSHFLLVKADTGDSRGEEPHIYDMQAWGEPQVLDVNPGPASSRANRFTPFDGRLYFNAEDSTLGSARRLFSTDGTDSVEADGFRVEPEPSYQVGGLRALGDELLISGWSWSNFGAGQELWTLADSSGSEARMVTDVNGEANLDPDLAAGVDDGSTILFPGLAYRVPGSGLQVYGLFAYDGTEITQVYAEPNRYPGGVAAFNGSFLFTYFDPDEGMEPHIWDGSEVIDPPPLMPGTDSSIRPFGADTRWSAAPVRNGLLIPSAHPDMDVIYAFDGTEVTRFASSTDGVGLSAMGLAPVSSGDVVFFNAVYDAELGYNVARLGVLRLQSNASPSVVVSAGGVASAEGTPLAVSAEVSDADGDPVDVSWTATTTNGASCQVTPSTDTVSPPVGGTATANASVTCDDQTTVTITADVDDRQGGTATDSVNVDVTNTAPAIGTTSLSSTDIDPGGSVTATANVTDPGNDTVTCTFTWGVPAQFTTTDTAEGGVCTSAQVFPDAGSYAVRVTADDAEGGTDGPDTVDIVNVVGNKLFVSTTTTTTFTSPAGAIVGNQTFAGTGNVTISKIGPAAKILPTDPDYDGKWSFFVGKSANPEVKFVSTKVTSMQVNTTTGYITISGLGTYTRKGQAPLTGQEFRIYAVAQATGLDQFRTRILRVCSTTGCGNGTRLYDNDPTGDTTNPPPITKGNIAITAS